MVIFHNTIFISTTIFIVSLLSKYPHQIPPSLVLDMTGRACNAYQVLAHILFSYQVIYYKKQDTIYGGHNNQNLQEFALSSIFDYFGWITIFSRLQHVPFGAKLIANAHIAATIMAALDFDTFQNLYIRAAYNNMWILTRVAFLLVDGLGRGYYQFVIL